MYTITAILWSYENGQLVYDEETLFSINTQDDRPVVAANGSFELSEGGSVQFTLAYTHPLYNELTPLETYIRVTDDSEEIFYGRILSKTDPTFTGQISYTAEGALSFLRDGEVPPEARDAKGQQGSRNMTAEAFFRWCIAQHNATVSDPRRQFTVGQITVTKKSETKDYQITNFTDTRSAIDQNLRNVYGGYLRARSDGNGGQYIDWIQEYDRLDPQDIELSVNVMELTNTLSADGVYTVLRPVGTNGLLLDQETIDLFPPEKMATMGRIVKSVTFQNADTKEKLQKLATAYAAKFDTIILGETSIRMIDMHYLDGTVPKVHIGDRFDHIHGNEGIEFTVSHMDLDFLHVENDSFSFKNRKDLEGDLNGGLSGGTISRATSRGARSAGLGLKYYSETTDKAVLATKEIEIRATELLNVIANNARIATTNYERISRTLEIEDGFMVTDWPEWQPNHLYHKDDRISVIENHKRVGYICLEDEYTSRESWDEEEKTHWTPVESTKTSLTTLWGTDVIQNSNQIAQVAGNFQVLTDYYDDWPTWQPDHDYKVNDRIKRSVGGKYFGYVCTRAHHSSTNLEDDLDRYWEEQHNRKSVRLLDGAAFQVDDLNGNMMTVGARIDTLGGDLSNLNEVVNEQGEIVTGMVGSALWTQREQITGVSGEFDVVTDTTTGKKRLVIKSGGGIKIRKDNTEFGLYDESNLTGGILVQKINDGSTVTKISGDKVNITATQIASWGVYTDDTLTGGIIAEKINDGSTVTKINGDKINITATQIASWGVYTDDTLTGGIIAEKINDDTTVTKILGSKVEIDSTQVKVGSTSTVAAWMSETGQDIEELEGLVADKATIGQLTAQKARIDTLVTHDLIANGSLQVTGGDIFTTGNINAGLSQDKYIRGKTLRLIGASSSQGAQEAILSYSDVDGMIIKAAVSGNTLQLWKHGDNLAGDPSITFSKATTLTPSWSGSPVTVAAKQLNSGTQTTVATFSSVIEPKFIHTTNPDKYYISIHHADNGAQSPSEYTSTRTEFTLGTLSATPTIVRVLNAGGTSFINDTPIYTIPLQANRPITSNGTFSASQSGAVGMSSVNVDITPTITGSWSNATFTATANPKSQKFTATVYVEPNGAVTKNTNFSGVVNVPIIAKSYVNGSETPVSTGYTNTITANVSSLLQNRGTVTANDTYTPGSTYIGISSIKVDITPTITGSWSNGTFTATANPKSQKYTATAYVQSNGNVAKNTQFQGVVNVPLKISSYVGGSETPVDTGYTTSFAANVSSLLQDRGTVTANDTYTPGSTYIGISSIKVDVTPTVASSGWSGGVYTVTINPKSVQNNTRIYDLGLGTATKHPDYNNAISVPYDVGYGALVDGQWRRGGSTGKTGTAGISVASLLQDRTVTSNNTYTANYSSGYIGLKSVTVDVTPSVVSSTWADKICTVTIDPKSVKHYVRLHDIGLGTATKHPDYNNAIALPYDVGYQTLVNGEWRRGGSTGLAGTASVSVYSLLQDRTVTSNNTYTANYSSGYIGLKSVTVNVTPSIVSSTWANKICTVTIDPNSVKHYVRLYNVEFGTATKDPDHNNAISIPYDVGYASLVNGEWRRGGSTGLTGTKNVSVSSLLQDRTVTSNNTYTANYSSGYIGLKSVTVNVTPSVVSSTWANKICTVTIDPNSVKHYVRLYNVEFGTVTKDPDHNNAISIPYDVGYASLVNGEWRRGGSTGLAGTKNVSVSSFLQDKTVTSTTGTVTADYSDGYVGLKSVTLNITVPTASNIRFGGWQVSASKPTEVGTYTDLTTLRDYMRNNKNTYVWFKATLSNGSGTQWCRVATPGS